MSHTENLTIMFTDIADYSESVAKMSRKDSEEMLKMHDKILHKIVRQYKGRWIKSIGDSFLVVFRSPTDAALCGMAMHDALWEEMQAIEDENKHIRIRVALSLGEVRLTRHDVFGEAVNIAARLEGITPADSIYLTESVYLSMNKAEVLAEKAGSEHFKGSPEETVYYRIPRSVNRRVVADEPQDANEHFNYPFGGAHLKAQAIDTEINLEAISSALTETKYSAMSMSAMVVGVIAVVGTGALYLFHTSEPRGSVAAQQAAEAVTETPELITSVLPRLEPPGAGTPPEDAADETEQASQPAPTNPEPNDGSHLVSGATKLLEEQDFEGLQALVDEYAVTNPNPDLPYLSIIQGHLLLHKSGYRDAIGAYEKGLEAAPALAADSYLAAGLIALLDYQPTRTRSLIKKNLSGEIVDRLATRSGEKGMHSRHYAVKLLSDTGNSERIDSVGMHIWDLRELEKCKEKKISVVALRHLKDPRALPALKEAKGKTFMEQLRMTCLANEANTAITEIEAKAGTG